MTVRLVGAAVIVVALVAIVVVAAGRRDDDRAKPSGNPASRRSRVIDVSALERLGGADRAEIVCRTLRDFVAAAEREYANAWLPGDVSMQLLGVLDPHCDVVASEAHRCIATFFAADYYAGSLGYALPADVRTLRSIVDACDAGEMGERQRTALSRLFSGGRWGWAHRLAAIAIFDQFGDVAERDGVDRILVAKEAAWRPEVDAAVGLLAFDPRIQDHLVRIVGRRR